jgi:cation:H+ antiporter
MIEADPGLRPQAGDGGGGVLLSIALALLGLVMIILGGRFLVDGAVTLARVAGLTETVIGLTIVAVGTSMPELVTSVIAALRRHSDVALGNILGSNIYNVLGIGGVTALLAPTAIPEPIASFDNLVMVAVSLLLVVFALTGRRIDRIEGAIFLALYAGYTAWLIGRAPA